MSAYTPWTVMLDTLKSGALFAFSLMMFLCMLALCGWAFFGIFTGIKDELPIRVFVSVAGLFFALIGAYFVLYISLRFRWI